MSFFSLVGASENVLVSWSMQNDTTPKIEVDAEGNPLVVWEKGVSDSESHIYISDIKKGYDYAVSTGATKKENPVLAVDGNPGFRNPNYIHVAWELNSSGTNSIYHKMLYNRWYYNIFGTSVQEQELTSQPIKNPSIEVDEQANMHLVGDRMQGAGRDIYYMQVDKCGAEIVPITAITSTAGEAQYADMQYNDNGIYHLAWEDNLTGRNEIHASYSAQDLQVIDLYFDDAIPGNYSNFEMFAVVKNKGVEVNDAFVTFFDDGIQIGNSSKARIEGGGNATFSFSYNTSTIGNHSFNAWIDYYDWLNETVETNNNFTYILTVYNDSDNDGASDVREAEYGTNASDPDTDNDQVLDGKEILDYFEYDVVESEDFVKYSYSAALGSQGNFLTNDFFFPVKVHQFGVSLHTDASADDEKNFSQITVQVNITEAGNYTIYTMGSGDVGFTQDKYRDFFGNFSDDVVLGAIEMDLTSEMGIDATLLKEEKDYVYKEVMGGLSRPPGYNVDCPGGNCFIPTFDIVSSYSIKQHYTVTTIGMHNITFGIRLPFDSTLLPCKYRQYADEITTLVISTDKFFVQKQGMNATSDDTDNDGLIDGFEINSSCSPFNPDMDEDGLSDYYEFSPALGGGYVTDCAERDTDSDGIYDGIEIGLNGTEYDPYTEWDNRTPSHGFNSMPNNDSDPTTTTDPTDRDSDDDGLPDGWVDGWTWDSEDSWHFDSSTGWYPPGADTIPGFESAANVTRQRWEGEDLNGDGMVNTAKPIEENMTLNMTHCDWWTYKMGNASAEGETDPNDDDSDLDGISDSWEIRYGLNPLYITDGGEDADWQNGNINLIEKIGERVNRGILEMSYDVVSRMTICWNWSNSSADGLTNQQEYAAQTNPRYNDTDGDRASDWKEAKVVSYRTNIINGSLSWEHYGNSSGWIWFNGTVFNYNETRNNETFMPTVTWEDAYRLRVDQDKVLIRRTDDGSVIIHQITANQIWVWEPGTDMVNVDNDSYSDGDVHIYHNGTNINANSSQSPQADYVFKEIYFSDPLDPDCDEDGFKDGLEPNWNHDPDGDGISNACDEDSDWDGLADASVYEEGEDGFYHVNQGVDTDGDGFYDFEDLDSDSDMILDSFNVSIANTTELYTYFTTIHNLSYTEAGGYATFPGEMDLYTDSKNPDTDNDGLLDNGNITMDNTTDPRYIYFMSEGIVYVNNTGVYTFVGDSGMGSDPRDIDSDRDGLTDGWDYNKTSYPQHYYIGEFTVNTSPSMNDTDGDGLSDGKEVYGFNLQMYKMNDYRVVNWTNSDPTVQDTDNDGWNDSFEYRYSNPRMNDTDSDGVNDTMEDVNQDKNMSVNESSPVHQDSDGDSLPDGWVDLDGDGNRDRCEFEDYDLDGVKDANESHFGIRDTDGDGLTDGKEECIIYMRTNIDINSLSYNLSTGFRFSKPNASDGYQGGDWISTMVPLVNLGRGEYDYYDYDNMLIFYFRERAIRNSSSISTNENLMTELNVSLPDNYKLFFYPTESYIENTMKWSEIWEYQNIAEDKAPGTLYMRYNWTYDSTIYYDYYKFERRLPEIEIRKGLRVRGLRNSFIQSGYMYPDAFAEFPSIFEYNRRISSSLDNDTDNDSISDYDEHRKLGDWDLDGDGLINNLDNDSDADGILDGDDLWQNISQGWERRWWHDYDMDGYINCLDAYSDNGANNDREFRAEKAYNDGEEDDTDHDLSTKENATDRNGRYDGWNETNALGGADYDRDGIGDSDEDIFGTDFTDPDSDNDGLNDGYEIFGGYWTLDIDGDGANNALDIDSDGDGLLDGDSVFTTNSSGTFSGLDNQSIRYRDWGNGSVTFFGETDLGTDPWDAHTDDDGIQDGTEVYYYLDTDGDGYINALDMDSDGDGLEDHEEDENRDGMIGFIYTNETDGYFETNPANEDTDHDGLTDLEEVIPGSDNFTTDPNSPDTDNDGIRDGVEVANFMNPTGRDSDGDNIPDQFDAMPNGYYLAYETKSLPLMTKRVDPGFVRQDDLVFAVFNGEKVDNSKFDDDYVNSNAPCKHPEVVGYTVCHSSAMDDIETGANLDEQNREIYEIDRLQPEGRDSSGEWVFPKGFSKSDHDDQYWWYFSVDIVNMSMWNPDKETSSDSQQGPYHMFQMPLADYKDQEIEIQMEVNQSVMWSLDINTYRYADSIDTGGKGRFAVPILRWQLYPEVSSESDVNKPFAVKYYEDKREDPYAPKAQGIAKLEWLTPGTGDLWHCESDQYGIGCGMNYTKDWQPYRARIKLSSTDINYSQSDKWYLKLSYEFMDFTRSDKGERVNKIYPRSTRYFRNIGGYKHTIQYNPYKVFAKPAINMKSYVNTLNDATKMSHGSTTIGGVYTCFFDMEGYTVSQINNLSFQASSDNENCDAIVVNGTSMNRIEKFLAKNITGWDSAWKPVGILPANTLTGSFYGHEAYSVDRIEMIPINLLHFHNIYDNYTKYGSGYYRPRTSKNEGGMRVLDDYQDIFINSDYGNSSQGRVIKRKDSLNSTAVRFYSSTFENKSVTTADAGFNPGDYSYYHNKVHHISITKRAASPDKDALETTDVIAYQLENPSFLNTSDTFEYTIYQKWGRVTAAGLEGGQIVVISFPTDMYSENKWAYFWSQQGLDTITDTFSAITELKAAWNTLKWKDAVNRVPFEALVLGGIEVGVYIYEYDQCDSDSCRLKYKTMIAQTTTSVTVSALLYMIPGVGPIFAAIDFITVVGTYLLADAGYIPSYMSGMNFIAVITEGWAEFMNNFGFSYIHNDEKEDVANKAFSKLQDWMWDYAYEKEYTDGVLYMGEHPD